MAYHVLHEGRRIGPYDRRTIVGLRIKKTLSSAHLLEGSDGSRLTVAELLGRPAPAEFDAMDSGAYSSARHSCTGGFIDSDPGRIEIPAFRGEVEVRVHPEALRIAGTYRTGRAIRNGRVKLPLKDISYARVAGSRLDLWLRAGQGEDGSAGLQRLALDLFSDESARELLAWLPGVQPWPHGEAAPGARSNAWARPLLWAAVIAIALAAGVVLWMALSRKF